MMVGLSLSIRNTLSSHWLTRETRQWRDDNIYYYPYKDMEREYQSRSVSYVESCEGKSDVHEINKKCVPCEASPKSWYIVRTEYQKKIVVVIHLVSLFVIVFQWDSMKLLFIRLSDGKGMQLQHQESSYSWISELNFFLHSSGCHFFINAVKKTRFEVNCPEGLHSP